MEISSYSKVEDEKVSIDSSFLYIIKMEVLKNFYKMMEKNQLA